MFGKSFVAPLTDFFCSPAFYAKVATFCLLSSALLVRGEEWVEQCHAEKHGGKHHSFFVIAIRILNHF
jgi:hypothetical protein